MPRISRNLLGNILCHHMVQGINKENIFQTKEDKTKYLKLLEKYYLKYKVNIIAYCIMDNHSHFLMHTEETQNISNFMKQVNSIYAMDYNRRKNRVGYVYRNRFKSVPIMTREQMYKCIKYIHMNPVKAGIVNDEAKYEYSSYNDYLNQTGFINEKILQFIFSSSKNYIEKFQKIEYEDLNLEKESINIKELFENFLSQEGIEISEIGKNKILIDKLIAYLNSKECKYTKTEIAKILNISRATFYRVITKQK